MPSHASLPFSLRQATVEADVPKVQSLHCAPLLAGLERSRDHYFHSPDPPWMLTLDPHPLEGVGPESSGQGSGVSNPYRF